MNLTEKIRSLFDVSFWDNIYKTLTFRDLLIAASPAALKRAVKRNAAKQQRMLKELKEKQKITVAFFLQSPSVWKYDRLYWLFDKSERFEPVVVITPFNVHLNYDKGEMRNVMNQSEEFAKKSGYRYFQTFDSERNKWLDIRKTLNPDIIFYTKPYKDTLPQYHIYRFPDKLNCYAPYGMMNIDIFRIVYNLPFHNLLWRFFVETEYQAGYSREYQTCGGTNTVVSGSLGMESLMLPDYKPVDVWKPQPVRKKRIIWAPHHTVDYLFNFSNFFAYCDFMFELAEKYKDDIQIAFKPHPVLKFKLINIWGTERTEAYYQRWRDLPNGQPEEGYYADLFLTSDAMIHDCASFTAEYLYTKKPTMFIVKDKDANHWNSFGQKCFDLHYHAYQPSDVEDYIKNVVVAGNDTMQAARDEFYKEYLYPKDGVLPSQKIVNTILDELA
jgi:hypothetical protein